MPINFNRVEFIRSAASPKDFLRDGLPQLAFAGRSNVGKSSVINRIVNRKNFARVGASPGKTSQINYFLLDERAYLVDLPGYGYTRANVEIKTEWGRMIEKYLHSSGQLRAVFLLVDIRHEPSENDRIMYEWIKEQGFAPVIIATKLDKINRSQIARHVRQIREGLKAREDTTVIPWSAQTRQGREEIYELIDSYLEHAQA